ncbi:MAG: peptide ABC transporter ATP-binding protein, partial [Acidobacteria bacterium]
MPTEINKGADIEAQNLSRNYRMGESEIRAVNDVSFSIAAGEFVALLGTSGSGKSSLLNLIAGLDTPTAGSVAVAGRDLARMSREELARYRRSTVGM